MKKFSYACVMYKFYVITGEIIDVYRFSSQKYNIKSFKQIPAY